MRADLDQNRSFMGISGILQGPQSTELEEEAAREPGTISARLETRQNLFAVRRIACFFSLVAFLIFGLNALITYGLRRIKTGQYGVSNRVMQGEVNAKIIVTGSSRTLSHFDPRIIEEQTGRSAFNLGRNGSQTDMQLAVLKVYLEHNRAPEVVIHNLDGFSFEATREVYNPTQYVPYLYDDELYNALKQFDPNSWRRRYLPVYGYVVDDMSLSWMLGLRALSGWSPREDFFQGFNPRSKRWTDEFQRFKDSKPNGVSWPIDPEGRQSLEDLIHVCQQHGIQLIFVYSPEYIGMQKLTNNRAEIFQDFRELSTRYHIPFWDYSNWKYSGDTEYFQNSQHLNGDGAAIFSADFANRLKEHLGTQSTISAGLEPSK